MDLKSVWKERPCAVRAGYESLSIPLSVSFLVVLLHNFGVLGRRKFPRFQSVYLPVKFLMGLGAWPALLFWQFALLYFPLLLARLDVNLQAARSILATTA